MNSSEIELLPVFVVDTAQTDPPEMVETQPIAEPAQVLYVGKMALVGLRELVELRAQWTRFQADREIDRLVGYSRYSI